MSALGVMCAVIYVLYEGTKPLAIAFHPDFATVAAWQSRFCGGTTEHLRPVPTCQRGRGVGTRSEPSSRSNLACGLTT